MILQGFDTEGYIRLVTAFLTRICESFLPIPVLVRPVSPAASSLSLLLLPPGSFKMWILVAALSPAVTSVYSFSDFLID